jgi:hypothetical protein
MTTVALASCSGSTGETLTVAFDFARISLGLAGSMNSSFAICLFSSLI